MEGIPRMRERRAMYAGSFDPITNGHIWVIQKGIELFDHLYVAIGVNPKKQGYFSVEERMSMIREYIFRVGLKDRVTPISFQDEFAVNVAMDHHCQYLLRGIRNQTDFAYELEIQQFNYELQPDIETIYVVPPKDLSNRSSSIVRGCVGLKGWERAIDNYTTQYVVTKLKERLQADS